MSAFATAGLVSRFCMANGTWDVVDASGCRNQQIVDLQQQVRTASTFSITSISFLYHGNSHSTPPIPHSPYPTPSLQLNQIANQPLAVGVPLAPMEEEQLQNLTDMLATTLAELSARGISTFPSDLETVNAFIEIITR